MSAADERGQAGVFLLGVLILVVLGALVLGAIARGVGAQADQQRAADLGALAGARAMHDAYQGLFTPAVAGEPGVQHLDLADYLARGRAAAVDAARRNGAADVAVTFPRTTGELAPLRIDVTVRDKIATPGGAVPAGARAEAELAVEAVGGDGVDPSAGDYQGPFAMRQGKPMRPDTALAFDRMNAAATKAGHPLIVSSAFRSSAEQAQLFAAHPDPKWVAPPGKSLHRLGTELDLAPPGAYAWLLANSERFHFKRRYPWEPWHFGYELNAGTGSVGQLAGHYDPDRHTSLPSFVPSQFAQPIAKAAQRWNVSGTLLAAQLYQESHFNPNARSGAGAQGIAQFMPGTAASYGLSNPFDASAAIDAQGHLMRDLLRQFGGVALALAAYNAGPAPVQGCGCVPPIPETQAYVAAILGLMRGAGDVSGTGGLEVRLVK